MGKIIELTHDDVQNELAYALICETMEGAYWNSGRRRRMFSKSCQELFRTELLYRLQRLIL